MKKILMLAVASAALVTTPAMAQFGSSNTDSAEIGATIAAICTISGPADNLTLAPNTVTSLGNVGAQCNDPDGFTATLTSLNNGVLKGADSNNATTIPYTFTITGVTDGDGPQSLSLPKAFNGTARQEAVDGFVLPMQIQTGATNGPAYADAYSDTITFSIVAN